MIYYLKRTFVDNIQILKYKYTITAFSNMADVRLSTYVNMFTSWCLIFFLLMRIC